MELDGLIELLRDELDVTEAQARKLAVGIILIEED